jgi:CheY-like chemotaxis protein
MYTPKVLIIDDDPDWREGSLKTPLLPLNYEVTAIENRAQALEQVRNQAFDLAILNIRLTYEEDEAKVISEWAGLLDLIKQREAEAIIVTSRSFPAHIQVDRLLRMAFKDFSVSDFMIKEDFNPIEYQETVQKTIAKRHKDCDRGKLCDKIDLHSTAQDIRRFQQALRRRHTEETGFRNYEELRGPGKWDKIDHLLAIWETYGTLCEACRIYCTEIRPQDARMRTDMRTICLDPTQHPFRN